MCSSEAADLIAHVRSSDRAEGWKSLSHASGRAIDERQISRATLGQACRSITGDGNYVDKDDEATHNSPQWSHRTHWLLLGTSVEKDVDYVR